MGKPQAVRSRAQVQSLTGFLSALFVALAGLAQGYRDGLLLRFACLHLGFDV
jgi:hypothetical protein